MYLGCIAVVFIMARLYFNTCNANIKKVENLYDECHEEIEDTLQNLLSIYTSRKITDESSRIADINEKTRQEQYNAGLCNRKFRIYFSVVNVFLFLALNYVSYQLFLTKKIQVANLVSIFILNYTILGTLMGLYESSKDFMALNTHIGLIETFINDLPKNDVTAHKKTIPNPEKLDIVFKDVTYKPETSEVKILDNFNLRLYPGQKIALVGASGSSKTSVISLIMGVKQFHGGNLFINSVSIKEIDIDDLRKHIVYIPQHPKLFNRTLEENLTYGLPKEITTEHIFKFMKDNGFTELEQIFRRRLKEKVGKTGERLSGGLRQIVWFLRAIMRESSLIVCDEPLNNLDLDSIKYVTKMIDFIGKTKGLIIVTHNLTITENLDRIITMDKGKIISDITKNKKNN
jgi:ABC-type bacteriocin/lantibiotic exporter with double-glycine peptidase domain